LGSQQILDSLNTYSKYPVPDNVGRDIEDYIARYGRVKVVRAGVDPDSKVTEANLGQLILVSEDPALIAEIVRHKAVKPYLQKQLSPTEVAVVPGMRGHVKQALVQVGYPAEDLAGYIEGEGLPLQLLPETEAGQNFALRHYQEEAAEVFYASGKAVGGSGTIVLPCGAGKTIVGMAAMAQLQASTLILCPNTVAVHQWRDELLDKTSLTPAEIGEYTGQSKDIRPVTIATYQVLTYRKRGSKKKTFNIEDFIHFGLFNARNWGLIIYDEVHLLPAPVFRVTAEIQARRRLGLTATLIREDGLESDVFSLIGPKRYDVPWKVLEREGWIATAECTEIRVALPEELRMEYALTDNRQKARFAAENPAKKEALYHLLKKHRNDQVLVIGTYLKQLEQIAKIIKAPLLTGKTSINEREKYYQAFRSGQISTLVVSKIANFSIDLPDANVGIEISGTFGSRQEEAQRLGRILRPNADGSPAYFYMLVTRDTVDQQFAANRQRFLTEQGYHYNIVYDDELLPEKAEATS
jgi:DNA excision repair protein ERCC-3